MLELFVTYFGDKLFESCTDSLHGLQSTTGVPPMEEIGIVSSLGFVHILKFFGIGNLVR